MIIMYLLPSFTLAQNNFCSKNGYTILTLNGINTTLRGAQENKASLEDKLHLSTFNSQPVTVDFLYNPTHVLQTDLVDAVFQKYFEQRSYTLEDSDFAHMLQDASEKLSTQKVLLVAHSQGNLYANTLYNAVVDEDGGVPSQSIGVYSVATPASSVAGGGKYLTSDTDAVIIGAVAKFPYANVLKPNTHIELTKEDGNGHSFSDVYLKYKGDKIKEDVEKSLSRLQNNNTQKENEACINPPKLTIAQKIQGVTLAVMDNTVNFYNNSISAAGNMYLALINKTGSLLAGLFGHSNVGAVVVSQNSSPVTPLLSETSVPLVVAPLEKPAEKKVVVENIQNTEIIKTSEVQDVPKTSAESAPTLVENPPQTPPRFVNNYSSGGGGVVITPVVPPVTLTPTPDTTPPVITLLGDKDVNLSVGSTFTDPLATAIDDVDGTVNVVASGAVDTSTEGLYTLTYTATDSSLNTSSITRRVNVDTGAKIFNPHAVFVKDNYAYLVSNSNALEVVDISDKSNPKHKGYLAHQNGGAELFNPADVLISGDHAYIPSPAGNTLEVVNVVDPLSLKHTSTIKQSFDGANLMNPSHVSVAANYAYVISAGQHKLDIIDISNPVSPVNTGQYYLGALSVPTALFVSNGYAYVTYRVSGLDIGGLMVIDISNPASPVLKSSVEDGQGNGVAILNPRAVLVYNDMAYIASGGGDAIEVVDVSNKDLLVHKSIVHNGDALALLAQPSSLAISGNSLFVASLPGNNIEVIDITDPSLPIHKSTVLNGDAGAMLLSPESIYISGNYAYIASGGSNALEILDITDPANPMHVGKIENGGF